MFKNKSIDINEGQAIYLGCPVKEDQTIEIEWFVTTNGTTKDIESYNNGYLYVPFAKRNDGGIYTCSASNSAGKVKASYVINISGKKFWHIF